MIMLNFEELRRITGPNLLSSEPGALVDINFSGISHEKIWSCWQQHMLSILKELNWQQQSLYSRNFDGGISLAISAPIDALYTACDAVELAWLLTEAELKSLPFEDKEQRLANLRQSLAEEINPPLLALIDLAKQHNVSYLVDDDYFSLGTGKTSQVWAIANLPEPSQIQWSSYKKIPAAFITGTNGKSTSVRLAATIAHCADMSAGVTSTDFIRVGDEILDTGDYSGPGGARILLRHQNTEIAFLEVARGGLLRRGLPVANNEAALITNIAADHLGQYGINTVAELAQAKFIVAKGLTDDGVLILNADDKELVKLAATDSHEIIWFSMDKNNPLIQASLAKNNTVVYYDQNQIHVKNINTPFAVSTHGFSVSTHDIAMTFNGTAIYNIRNAMGVIGLSCALNIDQHAIIKGLKIFGSDAKDNPGRGNRYQYQGADVIVDFAHNQHSMNAVIEMAKNIDCQRRMVMFSHGGDRTDQEILDLTDEIIKLAPDHYIIAELEVYLRGRELGEISNLVKQHLLANNVNENQIHTFNSPLAGAEYALSQAQQGDVLLLFTLDQRDKIHQLLQ